MTVHYRKHQFHTERLIFERYTLKCLENFIEGYLMTISSKAFLSSTHMHTQSMNYKGESGLIQLFPNNDHPSKVLKYSEKNRTNIIIKVIFLKYIKNMKQTIGRKMGKELNRLFTDKENHLDNKFKKWYLLISNQGILNQNLNKIPFQYIRLAHYF